MSQNGNNAFSGFPVPSGQFKHNGGLYDPAMLQALATFNFLLQQQMPADSPSQFMPRFDSHAMPSLQQFHQLAMMQQQQAPPNTPVKNVNVSPSNSSMLNHSDQLCNDFYNLQSIQTPPGALDEKSPLRELHRKAVRGCESGAKISEIHGKRPYFKKIDLLCNRMKTDLCVTNKAVVNINSHGVAWAIKDFIFAFTRIINAWVVLRDYVYSPNAGMKCVRDSIDPNFYSDFVEWQNASTKLITSLVQSFENLHASDQRNGNRRNKSESNFCNSSTSDSKKNQSEFQKIFDPLIAENSEQAQLGGGYLKSAVYKPVLTSDGPTLNSSEANDFEFLKNLYTESFTERSDNPTPLYKRSGFTPTHPRSKTSLADKFDMKPSDMTEDSGLGGISPMLEDMKLGSGFDSSYSK